MIKIEYRSPKYSVAVGIPMKDIFRINGLLPSHHKFQNGELVFLSTKANVEFLQKFFKNIQWNCSNCKAIFEGIEHTEKARKLKAEIAKTDLVIDDSGYEFKTKPYEHQKKAWMLARDSHAFAYLMDMGTGKTKTGIDDIAYQFEKDRIDTVIILAPNGVHSQWIEEQLPDHLPDRIKHKAMYYSSYLKAKEKRKLEATLAFKDGLRIIAMNIEALSYASGEKFAKKLVNSSKKIMVVLDESSRIKYYRSKRTRNIISIFKPCPIKRIMSGSPVTSGVENYYSQFLFLDPDIIGLSTMSSFKNRYCEVVQMDKYEKIVGYKRLDDLLSRIDPYAFRVKKEDCLDLPNKVYEQRYVEPTKEQIKMYETMKEELLIELDTGEIVEAKIALVKLLRLQQILSGHLLDENGNIVWEIPYEKNPRIKSCLEIMEETSSQVIIWARFKHDLRSLETALSKHYSVVTYHGSVDSTNKEKAIKDFKAGNAQIFLGNPASAGIGLNLNVANLMIYYSNSYNAEQRWQSEDRAHRIGMKGSLTIVDQVVKNSIDVRILQALKSRKELAALTVDGIKNLLQ
jgi:SNF2 family DNA or RNA helicase